MDDFLYGETGYLIRRARRSIRLIEADCEESKRMVDFWKAEMATARQRRTQFVDTLALTKGVIKESQNLLQALANALAVLPPRGSKESPPRD